MVARRSTSSESATTPVAAAGTVLTILGAAQFLMVLDTSVMNVSIATVAADIGTTVTGIQSAITLFTLVMATLMITGGKIGSIIGRRRAFSIGLVIYACGSATTAIAPNLAVLYLGWSILEAIGAALIMPAVVALVAGNVPSEGRTKAYGLIAAAGAIAVAVGPLIGGAATAYFSWRWVFAGEVIIAAIILLMARKLADSPSEDKPKLDLVGTGLTILGLGAIVYSVLQSSEWGWVKPKPGAPAIGGISATIWLLLAGGLVMFGFAMWERRVVARGGEPLVPPGMLKNRQLSGGLTMFFFQFLMQGGYFFVVPLFLSVVLELDALQTGARLVPLSLSLIIAAMGIPKLWPKASPRRVARVGIFMMLAALVTLMSGIDLGASASVVAVPMLLMGLGIGALASQLGAVAVSAVPEDQSAEVGGLQNTASNLGISLGTALTGSILIAVLTTSFLSAVSASPDLSDQLKSTANVQLAAGIPFLSTTQLQTELATTGLSAAEQQAVVAANEQARIQGLDASLAALAVIAVLSLFFTGMLPKEPPGATAPMAG